MEDAALRTLISYARKLADHMQKIAIDFNNMSDEQKNLIIKLDAIGGIMPVAILLFGKLVKGVGGVVGTQIEFSIPKIPMFYKYIRSMKVFKKSLMMEHEGRSRN